MFTNLARIAAILALVFGVATFAFGLAIAQEWLGPYDEISAQYGHSGKKIDKGIQAILIAAALGTLAEISVSVRLRLK